MICSDELDRQSIQAHRLVLLVAEVLVEEETVFAVSGFLMKKVMTLRGSAMLNEEEEMVLSSSVLVATWCFWGLFSWLDWAGGASALVWALLVFADLLVCYYNNQRFHE